MPASRNATWRDTTGPQVRTLDSDGCDQWPSSRSDQVSPCALFFGLIRRVPLQLLRIGDIPLQLLILEICYSHTSFNTLDPPAGYVFLWPPQTLAAGGRVPRRPRRAWPAAGNSGRPRQGLPPARPRQGLPPAACAPAAGPAACAPAAGAAHSVDRRRHLRQWTRSSNLSVDDGRRITEGQYGPYKKVRGIHTL